MDTRALFDLTGQTALVTGAGSGLGRAIACGYAAAGARVVCLDVQEATAAETVRLIAGDGGLALAVRADVRRSDEVRSAVEQAVGAWGRLDIAVANAGVGGAGLAAHEYPLDDWERVIGVNLTGVFITVSEAARVMVGQGRGKLILIGSIWGLVGSALKHVPAYAASKGGVVNLTRELAMEYARQGITVNCIAPGYFRTNLSSEARHTAGGPDWSATVPMRRIAEPEEIAGTALFFASRASDFVTGQVLAIDGGVLAY